MSRRERSYFSTPCVSLVVEEDRSHGTELLSLRVRCEGHKSSAQRGEPASADAMRSLAARSLGASPSVMRPMSPYSKLPPLAHSTTSPIACFLAVATRRAAVRNSLRSWLNLELPADPLPLLGTDEEGVSQACGLASPFPPETLEPFPGDPVSPSGFDGALPGVVSVWVSIVSSVATDCHGEPSFFTHVCISV